MGDGNGIDAGYGQAKVGAHGALGIVALIAVLMIAGILWVGREGFASMNKAHEEIRAGIHAQQQAADRLACVVSLAAEGRLALRRYDKDDFWSKCPWVRP